MVFHRAPHPRTRTRHPSDPLDTPSVRPDRPWAAVGMLAGATFAVVTTEMLPVGLLTSLGAGLDVSAGTAGLAVTLPGLVAAVAAPLLPVAVRRADRRTVLCALLLLLAAANLLTALAPAFPVVLLARLLVGVCMGGVWAVAAGLGARLLPGPSAGRATALVFSGIAVASVLGVPAGTFLGAAAGWRTAFAAMTGCALLVAAGLAVVLPPLPAEGAVRLGTFPGCSAPPGCGGCSSPSPCWSRATSPPTPTSAPSWNASRAPGRAWSAPCCSATDSRASPGTSRAARSPPAAPAAPCG